MDLHTAGHRRGVVAAPHHAAVEAGCAALAEGGNALEAMVAMAATIAAVYPHMTQLGGDGFWLVREPSGRVRALMAAGTPAPMRGASFTATTKRSRRAVRSRRSPCRARSPAGCWRWSAASAFGGRLRLGDLLAPAIRHAGDGTIVTPQPGPPHGGEARRAQGRARLRADLPLDGKPPDAGKTLQQPALAATLDHLAHAGLDDFYRGDVGREIAGDLDAHRQPGDARRPRALPRHARRTAVGRARCRHRLQHAAADPGPRVADHSRAVRALARRAGRRLRSRPRADRGDQARLRRARPRDHRSRSHAASGRSLPRRQVPRRRGGEDRPPQGRALAGARWRGRHRLDGRRRRRGPRRLLHPVALLGIRLRRGAAPDRRADAEPRRRAFRSIRGALNALAPGRLPFHTLNPALAVLADGRIIAYGAMGGDGQPQTQAAMFTRHVRYRMPLERAIDAPRWLLGRTWGSTHTNLRMESRFDGATRRPPRRRPDTRSRCCRSLIRTSWGMPGRWCSMRDGTLARRP